MRLDKTVARIFLIFSVANVALAAPVVDLQDVAKYATTVSEKRVSSDEGSTFTPSASGGSSSSSSVEMHPGTSTPEFLYGWEAEMRAQGMGAPGSDSEESLVSDHYSSEHSSLNSGGFLQAHGDDAASLPSTHHSTPPVSPPPPNHVSWTMPSSSSSHPDNLAPSVAPEVDKFFSDGMKQKLKGFALLGTAAGVVYGVNKFADKLYSRAYVSPLLPKSNRPTNLTCRLPQ